MNRDDVTTEIRAIKAGLRTLFPKPIYSSARSRRRRLLTVGVAVAFPVVALSGVGYAFWAATGTGTGTTTTGTLTAPGKPAGSVAGSTVTLSWGTATVAGNGSITYAVQRRLSTGSTFTSACGTPVVSGSSASCQDSPGSGSWIYRVNAAAASWTSQSPESDPVVLAAGTPKLVFSTVPTGNSTASSTATIGAYKVQEQDASGNPFNASSPVTITVSTTSAGTTGRTPFFSTTSGGSIATTTVAIGAGQSTTNGFFYSDTLAGTPTLTAHVSGFTDGTTQPTIVGAAASKFVVTGPGSNPVAGDPFAVNLAAVDAFGNAANGYSGAKTIDWTGATTSPAGNAPTYPASAVTFNSAGVATTGLSATLVAAGASTIAATDHAASSITGSMAGTVVAGSPTRLAWTGVSASGTRSSPCLFTCTDTGLGNNQTLSASVSVTDAQGNIVSNVGVGHTVTISVTQNQSGGGFTAPTSGAATETLTIASTGTATSTATFSYRSSNGASSWTDNLQAATAAGTSYTSATLSATKS